MKNSLSRFNLLSVSLVISFNAWSDATFTGDTNQTSSTTSPVAIATDIIVGNTQAGTPDAPSGTLNLSDGTVVDGALRAVAGNNAGSSGLINMSGSGTQLNLGRAMILGNAGYGTLNVTDGAQLVSSSFGANSASIGSGATGVGVATLSGIGSRWQTNGTVDVGTAGNGTLNVVDGATFSAGAALWLGRGNDAYGTLNVSNGGSVSVTTFTYLGNGNGSTGVVNMTSGGNATSRYTLIGGIGGTGNLNVSGSGAVWNDTQFISVGNQGTGSLLVADGGSVNLTSGGTVPGTDDSLEVATAAGSTGTVRVTGTGSTINAPLRASVGKSGSGQLTLSDGGTLNTSVVNVAQNAGSAGSLNIGSPSGEAATAPGTLNASGGVVFGAGSGSLTFNHISSAYTFALPISGPGAVNVEAGTTLLTGSNTYSGPTTLSGGTLEAGDTNVFSPASETIVNRAGTLRLAGYNQATAGLSNAGTVSLQGSTPGTILTVNGDYSGNGGLLVLNSVLGDDSSATDRLVVTGNTAGNTNVAITNLGGTGAQTLNGIEVVSVSGTSDGTFTQTGRLVAGAYDYQLTRGTGSGAGNWYLTDKRIEDNNGGGGDDNSGGDNGGEVVTPGEPLLRAEAGAYGSNFASASTLFNASLSDRLGETEYTDAITGEQKLTSLWLKNSGGHTGSYDSSGQLKTTSNRYVLMLGGDLATGESQGGSSWRLGALGGYGHSRSNTGSGVTGYRARGEVEGYTTGLYATWYADGSDERGLYLDSVLQYSWFDNTVNGQGIAAEKYRSRGLSAQLESGYVWQLTHSERLGWYIQPKIRAAWSGIKDNDHTEDNGTRISSSGNDNVTTSVGVRTFLKGYSKLDEGLDRSFKPFIEANWIHNSALYGVNMNGVTVSQAGTRNTGELKAGVEGRLTRALNLTGSVGQQIGANGYSDTEVMLGVKYTF